MSLLGNQGYLFGNIPAFGADPVFGTVFPLYIIGWETDAAQARPFTKIHVDPDGYPLHGHLIWATSSWWVERFTERGLVREIEIEKAFHRKYDTYFETRSRARKSFYVFSKGGNPAGSRAILRRIGSRPSGVLNRQG